MGLLHTSGRISPLWTGSTFVTDGRKSEVFSIRQSERGSNNHCFHTDTSVYWERRGRGQATLQTNYTQCMVAFKWHILTMR